VPYAENARTHSPSQVAQIAASITEFGFVNPVLVDAEGVLIAGHGRVMAAKQLGLATVPVLRLGHLSPAQARALRLADNQIGMNSGWDETLLAAEIGRIRDEAVVDLDVPGFSGMELDRLLAAADADLGDDADDAPPPPVVPVTRTGDLQQQTETTMTDRQASTARNQENSLAAFLAKKAEFDALLAELAQASGDHFGADPEATLWGEAAWLSDATVKLKDIADQHFRPGDYDVCPTRRPRGRRPRRPRSTTASPPKAPRPRP